MLRTCRERKTGGMPAMLQEWLPLSICSVLKCIEGEWEELHLRVGRACSVTVGGENRRIPLSFDREDMDALILRLCDESLYAHRDSINNGYLSMTGGIRIGLCGQAVTEGDEQLSDMRNIDAICIRFPHALRWVGECLDDRIRSVFSRGTLIYSPPGVGKTTLLRALAHRFSRGERGLRVVLADSRRELADGEFSSDTMISVLSGYPKGRDIEIAIRSLSPQMIVCDEIGNEREARAILGAAACGVPVIASVHADNLSQLIRRPGIDLLHANGVFGLYVGLTRGIGTRDYNYQLTAREDAEC